MGAQEVVIVVYDGVQLLDVAGPLEVFDGARRALGGSYRVRVASAGGRDVTTSAGVRLGVELDLSKAADDLDTVVVAGGWGYAEAMGDREMVGQLQRLAARARRVASVCTGAFVLAEAGLLDGRRATTHWAYCAALARAYPAVTVEPDAIFVRDAEVVTAAGVTAGVDLALSLVEEDHGAELARQVAKWLVVFLQRPGGQSQFSTWSRARPPGDDALRRRIGDIAADPAADLSIAAMAGRLSISPGMSAACSRASWGRARDAMWSGLGSRPHGCCWRTAGTAWRQLLGGVGSGPPKACAAPFFGSSRSHPAPIEIALPPPPPSDTGDRRGSRFPAV